MMQVWMLFRGLEALVGGICVAYHCMGFQGKEPLPHILLYCGTFFGFTVMSLTGVIALGVGAAPPALTEFIVNFVAALLYIVASIMSMHHAEMDFHLMYLSDFEEPKHPYFSYCRAQSICALAAGALHLMHAVLAFDVMFIPRLGAESSDDSDSDSESDATTLERRPIRMYFLSKVIETKLRRFQWFDRLCRRRSPTVSIFSFHRGHRKSGSTKIHASKYSVGGDSMKMPTSKSFLRPKPKEKEKGKSKKTADKPADKYQTKSAPTYLDDSPDSEEESVSRVTYSDFAGERQYSHQTLLTEKDEKPVKEKASLSPASDDNTRVSFSGTVDDGKRTPTSGLPARPSQRSSQLDPAQLHSILRKELSSEKMSSDEVSPKDPATTPSTPTQETTKPKIGIGSATFQPFRLSKDQLSAQRPSPSVTSSTPRSILKSSSITPITSEMQSKLNFNAAQESPPVEEALSAYGDDQPLPASKSSLKLTTAQQKKKPSVSGSSQILPPPGTPVPLIPSTMSPLKPAGEQQETKPIADGSSQILPTGTPIPSMSSGMSTPELDAKQQETQPIAEKTTSIQSPKQLSPVSSIPSSPMRSTLSTQGENQPQPTAISASKLITEQQATKPATLDSSQSLPPDTPIAQLTPVPSTPTAVVSETLPVHGEEQQQINPTAFGSPEIQKPSPSISPVTNDALKPVAEQQESKPGINRSSQTLTPDMLKTQLTPVPSIPTEMPDLTPIPEQQKSTPTVGGSPQYLQPDTPTSHLTPASSLTPPFAQQPNDPRKKNAATSLPSLPYSDFSEEMLAQPVSMHKIDIGTSVPSLPFSDEDNEPISEQSQKVNYFTPTASAGSLFDEYKSGEEDGGATPTTSKEKLKKTHPPPQPPPPK